MENEVLFGENVCVCLVSVSNSTHRSKDSWNSCVTGASSFQPYRVYANEVTLVSFQRSSRWGHLPEKSTKIREFRTSALPLGLKKRKEGLEIELIINGQWLHLLDYITELLTWLGPKGSRLVNTTSARRWYVQKAHGSNTWPTHLPGPRHLFH